MLAWDRFLGVCESVTKDRCAYLGTASSRKHAFKIFVLGAVKSFFLVLGIISMTGRLFSLAPVSRAGFLSLTGSPPQREEFHSVLTFDDFDAFYNAWKDRSFFEKYCAGHEPFYPEASIFITFHQGFCAAFCRWILKESRFDLWDRWGEVLLAKLSEEDLFLENGEEISIIGFLLHSFDLHQGEAEKVLFSLVKHFRATFFLYSQGRYVPTGRTPW